MFTSNRSISGIRNPQSGYPRQWVIRNPQSAIRNPQSAIIRNPQSAIRNPHSAPRRGFTLIELMIVVVIIAILMALILPAIQNSIRNVRVAGVKTDLTALNAAIADFKANYGIEPPSGITLYEQGADWAGDDASRALIRRMWPQFVFAIDRDINLDGDDTDTLELTGAECLVFFLAGLVDPDPPVALGFSKNPANPFATGGNRVGPFTEFRTNRFMDGDDDGMFEYLDSIPGQTSPIIYASSYDGRGYETADLAPSTLSSVYLQSSGGQAWNPKSFQIISPGFDGLYGDGGVYNPEDPSTLAEVERDNITNFASGMLAR